MRFLFLASCILGSVMVFGCATEQKAAITISDVKKSVSAYEGAELTLSGRVGAPLNLPKSNAQIFRLSDGKDAIWVFKKSGERLLETEEVEISGRIKAGVEIAGRYYGSMLISETVARVPSK